MYITDFLVNTIIVQKGAFMVSISLKSLNKKTIINLEQLLVKYNFINIIFVKRDFKIYHNLIIHFKGPDKNLFYKNISDLISDYIISNYEKSILKSQLKLDFFYLSTFEQEEILNSVNKTLQKKNNQKQKRALLNEIAYSYIVNNKKIYIDGFINFQISNYKKYLNNLLENEIHAYIIKKEYDEYIDLLRSYIHEKTKNNENQTELIHLFYTDNNKTILDRNLNLITTSNEKKYLCDISFSENDFILNSILSIMPEKIMIHTKNKNDNFVIFLQSIFENNCIICTKCEYCNNINLNKKIINTIE